MIFVENFRIMLTITRGNDVAPIRAKLREKIYTIEKTNLSEIFSTKKHEINSATYIYFFNIALIRAMR